MQGSACESQPRMSQNGDVEPDMIQRSALQRLPQLLQSLSTTTDDVKPSNIIDEMGGRVSVLSS